MFLCPLCKNAFNSEDFKSHSRLCKPTTTLVQKVGHIEINKETRCYKVEHAIRKNRKTKLNYLTLKKGALVKRFVPQRKHVMTPAFLNVGKKEVRVLVHVLNDKDIVVQPDEMINYFQFESLFRLPMRSKSRKIKKHKFAIRVFDPCQKCLVCKNLETAQNGQSSSSSMSLAKN